MCGIFFANLGAGWSGAGRGKCEGVGTGKRAGEGREVKKKIDILIYLPFRTLQIEGK